MAAMAPATANHHLDGRTSWSLTTGGGGGAGRWETGCMRSCGPTARGARIGDIPHRRGRGGEPLGHEGELVVRLHDRDADVPRPGLAVELAGRHDGAGRPGEPPGQR